MRKFLFFFAFLTLCFFNAQTKTKYELKREQLLLQLFADLGVGQEEINLIKNEKDEAKKTKMFFSRLQSIPNSYTNKALLEQYKFDLQQAQSLKAKADFDKEKIEEEKIEQLRLGEKEKAEIKKQELAKTITNENVFNYFVQTNMNNWLKKGEFEKEEVVNSRIQNEYKTKFQEICLNSAIETFDRTVYSISSIGTYNSENEFFPTELTLTTSSGSSHKDVTIRKTINGKIFVPIVDAESFKNSFRPIQRLHIDKFQLKDFKNFKWKNSESFFIPAEFEYFINVRNYTENFSKYYKFQFSDENLKSIIINANDFNLEKKENVDFDFDLAINNYAEKDRKILAEQRGEIPKTNEIKKENIKEKAKEEGKKLLKKFGF